MRRNLDSGADLIELNRQMELCAVREKHPRGLPLPESKFIDPLLDQIQGFLALSGMSENRFGILSCGDPALILRLRRGAQVKKAEKRAKIEAFIKAETAKHL